MKNYLITILSLLLIFNVVTGQITKEEATNKAFEYVKKLDLKECLIYFKKEVVDKNFEMQTLDKSFNSMTDQSYVFFIDRFPLQNWAHPCSYLFVNLKNGTIHVIEWNLPPSKLADWNLLTEIKESAPRGLLNFKNKGLGQSKTLLSSDHCYAIIISGGIDQANNWQRYWNDCSFIYSTLVNVYNFEDSHIKCLISDGTSAYADRRISGGYDSSPLDLDGDSDNDIDYSATKSNITTVFNNLSSVIDEDDLLFIFVTDHGNYESGHAYIYLWGYGEKIWDYEFADEVDKINAAQITIVMEQCHSGGFIDDLTYSNRTIATACDYDESSYGMGYYTYNEFVFDWIAAVAGEDPYENPVDADDNEDGIVSMLEAFNYAEANDSQSETPQYYSNPDDLGYFLQLESGLYISGSCLVCSSGTQYTINGLGAGTSITWYCSGNITRVSNQGSNPCEFEPDEEGDDGWIDATLTDNSYQISLSHKDVWVGVPPLDYVSGPDEGYVYNTYTFYAHPQRDPLSQAEYEWILNPLLDNDVRPYYDYTDIAFYDAYCCYQVVARAYNTCGYSDYEFTNIEIYDSKRMFVLSPNPASEFVTISLAKSVSSDLNEAEIKLSTIDYSIQIVDLYGNLHFSGTRSGDSFTIPVNNLKNGNYFVHINDGKEKFNLKLIIK